MGTIEFLCDFHERCHQTQELILLAKEKSKGRSEDVAAIDFESDKENKAPVKTGVKRKTKRSKYSKAVKRAKTAKIRAFPGAGNLKAENKTKRVTTKNGMNSLSTNGIRPNAKTSDLPNCQFFEPKSSSPESHGRDEQSSSRRVQNVSTSTSDVGATGAVATVKNENFDSCDEREIKLEIFETVCDDNFGKKLRKTRRSNAGTRKNSTREEAESAKRSARNDGRSLAKENGERMTDDIPIGSTAKENDDAQILEVEAIGAPDNAAREIDEIKSTVEVNGMCEENEIATSVRLKNSGKESIQSFSADKNSEENDRSSTRYGKNAYRRSPMKNNRKSNKLKSHSESKKNREDKHIKGETEEKEAAKSQINARESFSPLVMLGQSNASSSRNIDDNKNASTEPNSERRTSSKTKRNSNDVENASRREEIHAGNAGADGSAALGTDDSPVNLENHPNNTKRSRAVPVIVKKEQLEADEKLSQFSRSNGFVWLPCAIFEPEKPIAEQTDLSAMRSPAPGDEADGERVKNAQTSNFQATNPVDRIGAEDPPAQGNGASSSPNNSGEQVRKSVIELLPRNTRTNIDVETGSNGEDVKGECSLENPKDNLELRKLANVSQQEIVERDSSENDAGWKMDEGQKDGNFRERRRSAEGKFGKVAELISEEQKKVIETFYRVDMRLVDNDEVYRNVTCVDRTTLKCNICGSTYPRMDKCQVHVWGHLNMKPYCCNACDFATVTVSNVRCHIRKSHLKIKPFECHLCEKKYVTAVLLEEHLNSHTGAKPYQCKLCSFSSASRQVLSYHKTTHKPVKDISCDVCGKEFFSKSRMRAHMIVHNKDKRILCKLCSTYLCNEEALQKHYGNVHSHDYVCDICGKRTKSKKALHNHRNVHSAAKYKCPICPNVYKSSHILKEHLLKHEGIRKYRCQVCEKAFAQQSHLAAHMAVHSDRRFPCPGCSRPFNRQDNMKMHTRRCDAFLAKPELKNLLTRRIVYSSTARSDDRRASLENPMTSYVERDVMDPDPKTNAKANLETNKTDLELNARHSDAGAISLSLRSVAVDEDFDKLKSKESDVFRIGEVDIFPVLESSVPQIHMEGEVTVIENVLGPECF